MRGVTTVQLAAAIVTIGLLVALVVAVRGYIDGVDRKAYQRGQKEALLAVAERDNVALVAAQRRIEELKQLVQKKESEHAAAIAKIDAQKTREVADVEARKERFVGDVVAGRIRLFDPGRRDVACHSGGGGGAAEARAGTGVGDGAGGAELSAALAEFLGREAGRADKVVLKLQACQRIVEEDRKVCQ